MTGWECPGCGIQRAFHQLVHLNFVAAFKYNPFLVISMPYVVLLLLTRFAPANRFGRVRAFCYSATTIRCYLVVTILWWIVRNIY